MSGAAPERGGSERDIAAALRPRPDPPRVVRLSRRVLIGLAVAAGLGIGAALIAALQGRSGGEGPRELYSTDRNPQADGLATLPRDYAGIPQLGPPLPGDLGRPIVRAQERGQPVCRRRCPRPPIPWSSGGCRRSRRRGPVGSSCRSKHAASRAVLHPPDRQQRIPARCRSVPTAPTGGSPSWAGLQTAARPRRIDRRRPPAPSSSRPAAPSPRRC